MLAFIHKSRSTVLFSCIQIYHPKLHLNETQCTEQKPGRTPISLEPQHRLTFYCSKEPADSINGISKDQDWVTLLEPCKQKSTQYMLTPTCNFSFRTFIKIKFRKQSGRKNISMIKLLINFYLQTSGFFPLFAFSLLFCSSLLILRNVVSVKETKMCVWVLKLRCNSYSCAPRRKASVMLIFISCQKQMKQFCVLGIYHRAHALALPPLSHLCLQEQRPLSSELL